jgi:hypothetical protein
MSAELHPLRSWSGYSQVAALIVHVRLGTAFTDHFDGMLYIPETHVEGTPERLMRISLEYVVRDLTHALRDQGLTNPPPNTPVEQQVVLLPGRILPGSLQLVHGTTQCTDHDNVLVCVHFAEPLMLQVRCGARFCIQDGPCLSDCQLAGTLVPVLPAAPAAAWLGGRQQWFWRRCAHAAGGVILALRPPARPPANGPCARLCVGLALRAGGWQRCLHVPHGAAVPCAATCAQHAQ